MFTGRRLILPLVLCLLLVACRKDDIVEVPEARGRVFLEASSVSLERGGTAGIVFRCDVYSPGSNVSLRLHDGGAPKDFSLAGVSEGKVPGSCVAFISDNGVTAAYSKEVSVVVDREQSDYICVNCGATEYPSAVDTGLPVLYIDTENGRAVESRSTDYRAVLKARGGLGKPGTSPVSCTIRGRGNTSWSWPKKPYRIDIRDRVPLLGMPASGHWVLITNYQDRTLMRNIFSMKVAALTSLAWTPRCVPVELVMNGEHLGNYLLMEKVEADRDRVDISGDDCFLLESDFRYDGDVQWTDPHGLSRVLFGVPFAVKFPLPEDLAPEREARIKQYVKDAADALYSKGYDDPETGYAKWLDVDSFVDYWLVFEILGNPELVNPSSVYFHKDTGGKLTAGPCWDFDCCLRSVGTTVQEWTGLLNRYSIWYARLFQDTAFAEKVRRRYLELLPSLREAVVYIDEYRQMLAASAELNFSMWDPGTDRWVNQGILINGDENMSFDDAVTQLRELYLRRLEMLENNL